MVFHLFWPFWNLKFITIANFILFTTKKRVNFATDMKTSAIIRFLILGVLWLALVLMIVLRTERFTLYTLFVIVASAIIIFVPVYKKYVKNDRA